jgi:curved DNA-binding protein CbpA
MAEKVPRLLAHVDVRTFRLDATDGFLLSRIDGRSGPKDLARDTGLPEFQVDKTLEKLAKLGVIEIVDPSAPAAAPPPPPPQPRDRTQLPQFGSIGSAPKYDPQELEEDVELSLDQKKRVLDMFYRLEDLDHYTLLGIGKEADKKTIKRAYFELASLMHPDRYFKKKIGSFKPKMEALFGRITEAHDSLVDPAKRQDYDAYLDEVATTKGMEAMLERAVEESRRAAAAAAATIDLSAATSTFPPARPSSSPGAAISVAPPGLSAEDLQARREALARRLVGGQSLRPPSSMSPPASTANPLRYSNTGDAVDALKRRYEERIESATVAQAQRHVKAAEEALLKNNLVAAASALQIATKFTPDDVALAMRYQEVKNQADQLLCESYLKQATYEERSQHWIEAARSWQKVCKVKAGDGPSNFHAASCLLRADEADLHEAAEHAKVAVAAQPGTIDHHVTLAEIYLKAGLMASAKRAAEVGLAVDPKSSPLLAVQKKATNK